MPTFNKIATAGIAAIFASSSFTMPAQALSKADTNSLNYLQVKGTGLANRCSEVKGEGSITIAGGKKYKVTDLCLEPTSWQVSQ